MEGNLDFGKNFDLTLHILPQSKFDLGGEKIETKNSFTHIQNVLK